MAKLKTYSTAKATILGTLVTLVLMFSWTAPGAARTTYRIADPTGDWGYPSPYTHYARGPGYTRMSLIFETLVWKDDSGFVPALAEDWEYLPEENAYVFELRDNVTWHDGKPFTAQDVVFTFQYTKKHPYQWVDSTIVRSAKALDRQTVKLFLDRPYASFFQDVAGTQPIIPKHIWSEVDDPGKFVSEKAVVGTGPYTLLDYSKAHGTYLYEVYGDYYLGKAVIDRLQFVKISREMIPAALRKGRVDAGPVAPEMLPRLKEEGLRIISAPVAWNAKLAIHHQKEPLSSRAFRHALAHAIDRKALVQVTQRGHAVTGSPGLIPPGSDWYNPGTPQYPYDPDKAKALLEGLGYEMEGGTFSREGKELRIELLTTVRFKEVGQFIAGELADVGIKTEFRTLEAKTLDAKITAWDFDLAVYGHGGLYDPSILEKVITGEGFNSARYRENQSLNRMIEEQLSAMDREDRKQLVFKIQEMYAEMLPALTLYYPKWYWAHNEKVDLFYTAEGMASGIPLPLNRMAFLEGPQE